MLTYDDLCVPCLIETTGYDLDMNEKFPIPGINQLEHLTILKFNVSEGIIKQITALRNKKCIQAKEDKLMKVQNDFDYTLHSEQFMKKFYKKDFKQWF